MARIIGQIGCVLVLLALMSLFGRAPAHAAVVDTPHFKIDGLVIVWGASDDQSTTARIGTQMTVAPSPDTQSTAPQHMPQIPVTGQLVPVSDTDLVALSDSSMHFHVASNTAFSIDAELVSDAGRSTDALRATAFDLRASLGESERFGASAQYPHKAGPKGGMASDVRTLADLMNRTRVFTGNQPTAATTGSIMDQSVRFDIALGRADGHEQVGAPEIVFTVFVP